LLLALPGSVLADAALIASTPADDATLATVPPEAILEFDHALTGASSFVVLDESGATVAQGGPDPSDAMMMRGLLPALAAGEYEVRWTAGSDDGHIVRGTFRFSVTAPTAPPPTPAPTAPPTDGPAPTAAPSEASATAAPPSAAADPSPAPGGADGSGDPGGDVLLPIFAVAVIVAGGLIVMLRRRGAA
jgi:hypothetical protein